MPPQIQKGLFFSYKPAKTKLSANADSSELEKQEAPQRITAEGPEKPKKSCEPLNIPFRTFIKPYNKKHGKYKVIVPIVLAVLMIVIITVALLFCGVFQETKERAISDSTGEVLQRYTISPTTTAGYF